MKDSGVEWIGQIPEDWRTIRLKYLFIDRTGGAWGDEAKDNDGDIVCIRVADFDFGTQTIKDGNKTLRNYEQKTIERLKLEEHDLLIEKSGGGEKTPVGRTIIATGCRGFLFANFIDRLRIRSEHSPKYIAYFFRSLYYNGATNPYIKQTTGIQNLDIENLLRETIFVPTCAIQQRIADFLDAKCEKIDSLIANQQAQIEKLKEYKQAVITETVTKGLDKTAPIKYSGVEWIGQIPDSWSTIRFKDKYVNQKEIAGQKSVNYERLALTLNGVIKRSKDDSEGLQPKEFDGYQVIHENDFIFKMIDLQNVSTSRVGLSPYVGLVSPAYIRFSPRMDSQYNKFVYYFLMSMYYNCVYNNLAGNGVRSALNATDMGQFVIPYPSIAEQQQIADYLDKHCADIDRLISIKQRKIEKLQEYKKSLIYEYVTGKKEVA